LGSGDDEEAGKLMEQVAASIHFAPWAPSDMAGIYGDGFSVPSLEKQMQDLEDRLRRERAGGTPTVEN